MRPFVVSWNLTYRCNLQCEHCYLDAGAKSKVDTPGFSDRSELSTADCLKVVDQLTEVAPECVTILTGGEPLLRRDILEIVEYAASRKLWVVIGTNGVKVTSHLAQVLKEKGARGFALSLDALKPEAHDSFRMVKGAWENTVTGSKVLRDAEFPFIIQTTIGKHNITELEEIAEFAYKELGAKVWNLYFLVQTGRGQFVSDISGEEYDSALAKLANLQAKYFQKMLINAKCAPHYVRTLFETDPNSPFLKTFSDGAGGCPAGTHYLGIRPNGDMTPCPYLPVFGGNVLREKLTDIWEKSELFLSIRARKSLGGRCGTCEFNPLCGGCRARAYGVTGDYLAEDPLCTYQPGKHTAEVVQLSRRLVTYGTAEEKKIEWEEEATKRMAAIPAFVRGMVTKSVESYCEREGIAVVTVKELEAIRSRMPASRLFSKFSQTTN